MRIGVRSESQILLEVNFSELEYLNISPFSELDVAVFSLKLAEALKGKLSVPIQFSVIFECREDSALFIFDASSLDTFLSVEHTGRDSCLCTRCEMVRALDSGELDISKWSIKRKASASSERDYSLVISPYGGVVDRDRELKRGITKWLLLFGCMPPELSKTASSKLSGKRRARWLKDVVVYSKEFDDIVKLSSVLTMSELYESKRCRTQRVKLQR